MKIIIGRIGIGVIALFLTLQSCTDKQNSSTLEIVIRGTYAGKPLVFAPGVSYTYFDGSNISFTRSEFFISDIQLIDQNSHGLPVNGVYLCELQNHHISVSKAEEGYKIRIPVNYTGTFKGIRIGLGLPSELNNSKPSDYQSTNILSDGEHYWAGWNSYVFSKTEGQLSNGNKNVLFAYHTGFNEAFITKEILKPITLLPDQTGSINIEFDHERLFGTSADYTNIYENNIVHNGIDFMIKFMDQFKNAFN